MPVLLAVGYALGVVLAHAGRLAWRVLWWLLRVAWTLAWRATVVALALLVLPFSRRAAGWCLSLAALAALAAVRRRGRGGQAPYTEHRTAPPVRVTVRPVSAQRVVTTDYGAQRFFTRGVAGPELLTMTCGFAGCGKTEVLMGRWRAQFDGEDFCGLPTTRGKRKLLLTEMNRRTLGPVLERWGFAERPRGWLHDKRLRYLPLRSGPGAYVDVLYAEEVLAPVVVDGETVTPDWPNVVEAIAPLAVRGDYDEVAVDSLAEWLGDDSQGNMLRTLALCRQITRHGPAVDVLHHTPRSDPRRPRGSGAIEAKLDTGWSVYGLSPGYAPRSLHDPVRVYAPFKSRFPDDCPREPLQIERVWAGPDSGQRPRYRLAGKGAPVAPSSDPESPPPPALTPQVARVRDALQAAGPRGATTVQLAEATGLRRERAHEAVLALITASAARVGGYGEKPPGGGKPPRLYVAVDVRPSDSASPPRLRLVPPAGGAA